MIITDGDRRAVLTRYRQWRTRVKVAPEKVMHGICDYLAAEVRDAMLNDEDPRPEYVRQWAAADRYLTSMRDRPVYWRAGAR